MKTVRRGRWTPLAAILTAGGTLAASANSTGNPYAIIHERNAFGLSKAEPVKAPEPVVETAPPANITLTGITTTDGVKTAYLLVQEQGKPLPVSYAMEANPQGEGSGALRVLEINEVDGKVKLSYNSVVSTLGFTLKPVAGPALPGARPGLPTPMPAMGGAMPPRLPTPTSPQPMTIAPGGGGMAAPMLPTPSATAYPSSMRTVPSRTLRLQPGQPNAAVTVDRDVVSLNPSAIGVQPGRPLTAEESALIVAANAELNAEAVRQKKLPPFPPVPGMPTPGSPPTPPGH